MTAKIKFEPLANNDLKQPFYATEQAACMDFQSCLTRPCFLISKDDGAKLPFVAYSFAGRPLRSFLSEEETQAFEMPGSCSKYYRKNLPPQWETPTLHIIPQEIVMVSLGYKSQFSPSYMLSLYIRSSLSLKGLQLANGVGIIDADYRGELFVLLVNRSSEPILITHQDRIVQGSMTQIHQAVIESGTTDKTARGVGGFGSTGE
jgi:dUTP pyrophosphatase